MLFFDAAWSAPGRLMAPVAARIAREHGWPFLPIEAGDWPELVRRYGIKTLPELVLAHGDEVLRRWRGFHPEIALRAEIESLFKRGGADDEGR